MMVINNKYEHGQIVYLITDQDQLPRMVTQIIVCADGALTYQLSSGDEYSNHFEMEISATENIEIKCK
jgi:hypothetical protein